MFFCQLNLLAFGSNVAEVMSMFRRWNLERLPNLAKLFGILHLPRVHTIYTVQRVQEYPPGTSTTNIRQPPQPRKYGVIYLMDSFYKHSAISILNVLGALNHILWASILVWSILSRFGGILAEVSGRKLGNKINLNATKHS